MIKINLLPPAFKVAKKKKKNPVSVTVGNATGDWTSWPWKSIGIVVGGLFFLLTLYFYFDFVRLNKKMKTVGAVMAVDQPKMQGLKVLEKEVTESLIPERDFLMTHVLPH